MRQVHALPMALAGHSSSASCSAFPDSAESSTAPADSDTCSLRPASDLTDPADLQAMAREAEVFGSERGKRKRSSESAMSGLDPTTKSRLHDVCTALLNRKLQQGDIVYEVQEAINNNSDSVHNCVAHLRLPNMPGLLGEQAWSGGPCTSRREARHQAAASALEAISRGQFVQEVGEPANGIGNDAEATVGWDEPGPSNSSDLAAKSELFVFLQWKLGRTLDKTDIEYSTSRKDGKYHTTVRLYCFDKLEFIGEPASDAKAAQNIAASRVLEHFSKDVARMAKGMQSKKMFASKKRRKVSQTNDHCEEPKLSVVDMQSPRKLHDALKQILGRELSTGDVVYGFVGSSERFMCNLRLPCLIHTSCQETLGDKIWSSPDSCSSKRDARTHVACLALEDIQQRLGIRIE